MSRRGWGVVLAVLGFVALSTTAWSLVNNLSAVEVRVAVAAIGMATALLLLAGSAAALRPGARSRQSD